MFSNMIKIFENQLEIMIIFKIIYYFLGIKFRDFANFCLFAKIISQKHTKSFAKNNAKIFKIVTRKINPVMIFFFTEVPSNRENISARNFSKGSFAKINPTKFASFLIH